MNVRGSKIGCRRRRKHKTLIKEELRKPQEISEGGKERRGRCILLARRVI